MTLAGYAADACAKLQQLDSLFEQMNYDRSCAYPMLWAAEFHRRFGNPDRARLLLTRFRAHNIDIRNYSVPVQNLYATLFKSLQPALSVWLRLIINVLLKIP